MTLARFRVDPAKVRVSVRSAGVEWRATVTRRDGDLQPHMVRRMGLTPASAVDAALEAADAAGMVGIDLGMQRTYRHPMSGSGR